MATNDRNTVIYVGITNDLSRRMFEHGDRIDKSSFTSRYNIDKLVFAEEFSSPQDAIAAEKKLKGWTRAKKMALIEKGNPGLKDLLGNP